VTIVRDFTEQRRADAELRRLAEEQAALRRVATLVAGDAPPEHVFQQVTEEVSRLFRLRSALLFRYEDALSATIVGRFGHEPDEFRLGSLFVLDEGAALGVLRTGAPVRVDYKDLGGALAPRMLGFGFTSSHGVPISVGGRIWGALIASERAEQTLPAGTDRRLQAFAQLVALAVASAQASEELTASRRRIVEASDAERRRLERNLHDGAQQRLVGLSVGLQLVRSKLRAEPNEAGELLQLAFEELGEALTELRELAQGIHPAVLAERGLAAALQVLAARAPLPVVLDLGLRRPLPEPIEAACYFVASEALANVVKHADAASATVRTSYADSNAVIEITDDGCGGAVFDAGTGLHGLRDRVETLNGHLHLSSPTGRGTLVRAELPLL
jgi:signal transduction histidine kinase